MAKVFVRNNNEESLNIIRENFNEIMPEISDEVSRIINKYFSQKGNALN